MSTYKQAIILVVLPSAAAAELTLYIGIPGRRDVRYAYGCAYVCARRPWEIFAVNTWSA